MSNFLKLKKIHSLSGVYKVTAGSNIENELKAYSAGLDILTQALEEFERECFVDTACSYGLERRELMSGAQRDDLPIDLRRQMLLCRSYFGESDFTLEGILKVFEILGIEGSVVENPTQNKMVLKVKTGGLKKGQRNWILSQVAQLLPAHLETETIFEGASSVES